MRAVERNTTLIVLWITYHKFYCMQFSFFYDNYFKMFDPLGVYSLDLPRLQIIVPILVRCQIN